MWFATFLPVYTIDELVQKNYRICWACWIIHSFLCDCVFWLSYIYLLAPLFAASLLMFHHKKMLYVTWVLLQILDYFLIPTLTIFSFLQPFMCYDFSMIIFIPFPSNYAALINPFMIATFLLYNWCPFILIFLHLCAQLTR